MIEAASALPARTNTAPAFRALAGDSPCRHRGHPPFLGLLAPARIERPRWLHPPRPEHETLVSGHSPRICRAPSCAKEVAACNVARDDGAMRIKAQGAAGAGWVGMAGTRRYHANVPLVRIQLEVRTDTRGGPVVAAERPRAAPRPPRCSRLVGPLGRLGPGNRDTRACHEPKDEEKCIGSSPARAVRAEARPFWKFKLSK